MKQSIGYISLLVRDYDEALKFYTQALGFRLIEDLPIAEGKRWILVMPEGAQECQLLLAKAKNAEENQFVGRQGGGRVFLFLHTDDFFRDYNRMKTRGVHFCEEPRSESYGMVAVFEDLYGNKWDLLEPKSRTNQTG